MATRMLYPSLRPPRAMATSVRESAALLIAAMPTIAIVSRISVLICGARTKRRETQLAQTRTRSLSGSR